MRDRGGANILYNFENDHVSHYRILDFTIKRVSQKRNSHLADQAGYFSYVFQVLDYLCLELQIVSVCF